MAMGKWLNSGLFDGLSVEAGKAAVIDYMEKNGIGSRAVNYRLRDWLISLAALLGCSHSYRVLSRMRNSAGS